MTGWLSESIEYWSKGGMLLGPIALVCCFIWYYFLKLEFRLKKVLAAPSNLEHKIQDQLAEGLSVEQIIKKTRKKSPFTARILDYTQKQLTQGLSLRQIFDEVSGVELTFYQKDLTVLKSLVTAAPLLGLLGTVWGMIDTFTAISAQNTYSAEMVASGISVALITTQYGLIVALPGIFGISMIKRKIKQLEVRLALLELHLGLGLRRQDI